MRLNVVSRFSYTLETLIQAGKSDIAVTSVPIRTNPRTRESRLFKSTFQYINRSVETIFQIWTMYGPLPAFPLAGARLRPRRLSARRALPVALLRRRPARRATSSRSCLGAFLIVAFLLVMLGIISDLLRANRILTERALHRIRHVELALDVPPEKSLEESVEVRARLHRGAPGARPLLEPADQRFLPPCFAR